MPRWGRGEVGTAVPFPWQCMVGGQEGGEGGKRGYRGAAWWVRGEEGPSPPEGTWLFSAATFRGHFGWADA